MAAGVRRLSEYPVSLRAKRHRFSHAHRAGRIKYNVDISKFRHVHQSITPSWVVATPIRLARARPSTEDQCRPSPPSPDADRDAKFNHQIGANVARTDNGDFTLTLTDFLLGLRLKMSQQLNLCLDMGFKTIARIHRHHRT